MIYLSPTDVVSEGSEMNVLRDIRANVCRTQGWYRSYSNSLTAFKHDLVFRTVNRIKTRCVISEPMPPGWYDYHTHPVSFTAGTRPGKSGSVSRSKGPRICGGWS